MAAASIGFIPSATEFRLQEFLTALDTSGIAQFFRFSRLPYAALNGAHVFGIALLVGSATPIALRFLGFWKDLPATTFRRILSPVAAAGLAIAIVTGLLLFSVRATEYSGLGVFRMKMLLVIAGLAAAGIAHARDVFRPGASRASMAMHGAASLIAWTGALACGRLIAFSGE